MIEHPAQQPQGQDGSQSRNQFLPTSPSTEPIAWKGKVNWVRM